jgi:hypothetical protein
MAFCLATLPLPVAKLLRLCRGPEPTGIKQEL